MADSLNNINPRDLTDVKDSLIIQDQTTGPLTTNIYEIASYVDALKAHKLAIREMIKIDGDKKSHGVFSSVNIFDNCFPAISFGRAPSSSYSSCILLKGIFFRIASPRVSRARLRYL